jgi:hypothetical protein
MAIEIHGSWRSIGDMRPLGLTGIISITQEATGRKRGGTWKATFTPDLLSFLANFGRSKIYPDSLTLEYLNKRIWITLPKAEVMIKSRDRSDILAEKVLDLHGKGVAIGTIATMVGSTWHTCNQIVKDWVLEKTSGTAKRVRDGKACPVKKPSKKPRERRTKLRHQEIAEDVWRLKENELLSVNKIVIWLREHRGITVAPETVSRSWHIRRQKQYEAEGRGGSTSRPAARFSHLGPAVFEKVRNELKAGRSIAETARSAGCSPSTVSRVAVGLQGLRKRSP